MYYTLLQPALIKWKRKHFSNLLVIKCIQMLIKSCTFDEVNVIFTCVVCVYIYCDIVILCFEE